MVVKLFFFLAGNDEPFDLYYDNEDEAERPRISTLIQSLANYTNTIPSPNNDQEGECATAPVKSAEMGTLIGVYLPCIQNIFGVILFIRLTWVCIIVYKFHGEHAIQIQLLYFRL